MHLNILLGDELYAEVTNKLGGMSLYFPHKPTRMLIALFGDDKAKCLCQRLGGDTIYIKKNNLDAIEKRQEQFISRYNELLAEHSHKKALQLACHEFGFSDRWGDILIKRQNTLYSKKLSKNQLEFKW